MSRQIRKAVIFREISSVVNHGRLVPGRRYWVIEPEVGKKQVLVQYPDAVCKFADPNAVVGDILKYALESGDFEDLTHRDAVECEKYWKSITNPIPLPVYLREAQDPKSCFHRLSFNYSGPMKKTPVLDEFMSRCSNAEAVKMFIGSIFVENSSRYQYLWLYGPGGEGKGCFGRALARMIGPSATTMVVPKTDSQKQFLAYSLLGRRLCIFPECSNFAFPNDPLFKQLTGHDDVWIEQKGKQGYNAPINCKFVFFSNERAGVHGTDANTRRLIYSEIGKPTVKYTTQVYDALIAEEMPSFIIACRNKYLENCPMGDDIPFDDEITKQLLEFNEEPYMVLTEKWINIGVDLKATPKELRQIQTIEKMTLTDYRNWIEYMRRTHGITCENVWDGKKAVRVWRGMSCKDAGNVIRFPF